MSVGLLLLASACGSSGSSTTTTTGVRFTTAANFSQSASAALSVLRRVARKTTTAQCASLTAPITHDDPSLADGLDCDADGGLVAHVTPSRYTIAFKRVSLVPASGSTRIDFISDTGTLARSSVINFTTDDATETVITLSPSSLTAGSYTGIEAELYYFQLTFPVGGTTRNVRIYMSDDAFAAEGTLGHHQGDITFIDDSGTELGWVDSTWSTTATTRSSAQNGAGGTDAQTGHDRGFFGDTTLWNATAQVQGATQDIFLDTLTFATPLTIPDPSTITSLTTITATFSTADTFYYEDFVPQGTGFSPASGGEATSSAAEWAPLEPTATLSVQ